MITISEKEYKELKRYKEEFETLSSWNAKKGKQFKKLMFLKEFDVYARKTFPAYIEMVKQFEQESKIEGDA